MLPSLRKVTPSCLLRSPSRKRCCIVCSSRYSPVTRAEPSGCGVVDGLPVGLQLMGNYFDEARLFNVAHQYQKATEWHAQSPEAFA